MSQKLAKALAKGVVVALNATGGSVVVFLPLPDGTERTVLIPARQTAELVPKHTTPELLNRSRNLQSLLYRGVLRIK